MWIKIKAVPDQNPYICLPSIHPESGKTEPGVVIFGEKWNWAIIDAQKVSDDVSGKSYQNPLTVIASSSLIESLHLPAGLVYQLKREGTYVIIGPVIGLLLGNHPHLYSPRHMKKYSDRLGVYEKIGGLIFAFSVQNIHWDIKSIAGLSYNPITKGWEYGIFPFPSVIYRRNFHVSPDIVKKLVQVTRGRLFNSHRFTKYELYTILIKNEELMAHIPATEYITSWQDVKRFTDLFGKAILKPVDLSRGRGICIIKKAAKGFIIDDYRQRTPAILSLHDEDELREFFLLNPSLLKNYLIQKYIDLARINGSNYDIRVVMQKNTDLKWECTGIECRVANPLLLLTNISRGGYALPLSRAFALSFPDEKNFVHYQGIIYSIAQEICNCLDQTGEHYAELGLDVALDRDKNVWILEANVFPSFKGFINMDYQTYLAIRYRPLLYALSLTELTDLQSRE